MHQPPPATAGICPSDDRLQGLRWQTIGQRYTLKAHTEACMCVETEWDPGAAIPPHRHARHDEFAYVLEGEFELLLDGQAVVAREGDTVRIPRGTAHAVFNKSPGLARALMWTTPSLDLFALFARADGVEDPTAVMALCSEYDFEFLPPA